MGLPLHFQHSLFLTHLLSTSFIFTITITIHASSIRPSCETTTTTTATTTSKVFTVGDTKGWVVGIVNYTLWASNYTFYVGDTLVFNYLPEFHSVVEVRKEEYESCDAGNAIAEHRDGNTSIVLQRVGSYYYICGMNKHCPLGQKLKIKALIPPQDEDAAAAADHHNLISSPCTNPSLIAPSPSPSSPPSPAPLSSSSTPPSFSSSFLYLLLYISSLVSFFEITT